MISPAIVREELLRFAQKREACFCPSKVARALADDWRPLMPRVREEAALLVQAGSLLCTQTGAPAHPLTTRGAIRLRGADHA